ncbi:MAG: NAD(P)-dependent alcohol dehydrogenase [Acidobacteriota bacterium]|nr:NAD(P)-dependent alcohol dehydrogenase [Acidobacteriota bacterium]
MRAIVQEKYGPPEEVLQLREIGTPVVGDDEVLVRVRATSVHPDVWHVVTGRPYVLRLMGAGVSRPRNPVPGTDAAGIVESVGKGVTRFEPGDEVFGETHTKLQWRNGGAFAEFVSVPEETLALKPHGITFEQAAAVPTSGFIAVLNLESGTQIQPGQSVLINGAGGGVGSIAVQIAKAHGARVTGVDSTDKIEMVRSLGADHVIDYTREDFTQGSERYDFILDVASNLSLAASKRALTPKGVYVLIGHDHFGAGVGRVFGGLPRFLKLIALSPFVSQLPEISFSMPSKGEVMAVLKELLEAGKLTPVVDRTYPLEDVTDAMRRLVEGRACGRIIITP